MLAQTNGIEIEYETFGDPSGDPLLLIMGLGAQMVLWHEDLCNALAANGHYVIRFDNRDIGKSTKFDDHGTPDVFGLIMKVAQGESVSVPYTLHDMADDTAGLLDALGIASAHICGASMGGMIAQTLALRHPHRVKSLTSIMSTTGNRFLPPPKPEVLGVLTLPLPTDRESAIDRMVTVFRTIGSPGFPFDEAAIRERAAISYERSNHLGGQPRQLAAILVQEDRTEKLAALKVPALVIHGEDDPLVPVECGRATAEAIPGAELITVPGMGHDTPRALFTLAVDAITRNAKRAVG